MFSLQNRQKRGFWYKVKAKHWLENLPNHPPPCLPSLQQKEQKEKEKRKGSSVLWESESIWKVPQWQTQAKSGKTQTVSHRADYITVWSMSRKRKHEAMPQQQQQQRIHRNPHNHVVNLREVQRVGLLILAITVRRLLTVGDRDQTQRPSHLKCLWQHMLRSSDLLWLAKRKVIKYIYVECFTIVCKVCVRS